MNTNNLPAGLDNSSVELFTENESPMALFKRRVISFWDLPEHIIKVFRNEMNRSHTVKRFGYDSIQNENERLEKYVMHSYGQFDNVPDWKEGEGTQNELRGTDAATFYGLSRQEKNIMIMISNGFTDKDIAARLFISPFTVQTHRHNIIQKTGSRNAADLTRIAIEKQIQV